MRRVYLGLLATVIFGSSTASQATETITYTYDAKGRIVKVVRSGSVNNGVTVQYGHDRADNRTTVTVTGAH